jgi:hypothetical protein
MTPTIASTARSHFITLTIDNVQPLPALTQPTVHFGTRSCDVKSTTYTAAVTPAVAGTLEITCRLGRAEPESEWLVSVPPVVYIPRVGHADPQHFQLVVGLFVSSVSSHTGSMLGGNELVIEGRGFGAVASQITVTLLNATNLEQEIVACVPRLVTHTSIHCVIGMELSLLRDTRAYIYVNALSFYSDSDVGFGAPCRYTVCRYRFMRARTPVITSVAVSDPVTNTGTLTLTGVGLESPLQVSLGAHVCPIVTHASSTTVVCQLPVAPADDVDVMVVVASMGMARSSATHRFPLILDSVAPTVGSVAGGLLVTVSGQGFHPNASVTTATFGGVNATFVSATPSSLTVLTPALPSALSGAETVALQVTVLHTRRVMLDPAVSFYGTSATTLRRRVLSRIYSRPSQPESQEATASTASLPLQLSPLAHRGSRRLDSITSTGGATAGSIAGAFTFNPSIDYTPTIATVSPTSGWAGAVVTITGQGFRSSQDSSHVFIGGAPCTVSAWSDASITCTVGDAAAGVQNVMVTVELKGLAYAATAVVFTSNLEVRRV